MDRKFVQECENWAKIRNAQKFAEHKAFVDSCVKWLEERKAAPEPKRESMQ